MFLSIVEQIKNLKANVNHSLIDKNNLANLLPVDYLNKIRLAAHSSTQLTLSLACLPDQPGSIDYTVTKYLLEFFAYPVATQGDLPKMN